MGEIGAVEKIKMNSKELRGLITYTIIIILRVFILIEFFSMDLLAI